VLLLASLAFAPFVVLVTQRYGGEAIYRVFLFSAPWCCYLMAETFFGLSWKGLSKTVSLAVFIGAIALGGMQGLFGPLAYQEMPVADVETATWFYTHAAPGSALVLPDFNFPGPASPDYVDFGLYLLPDNPLDGKVTLSASSVSAVTAYVASVPGRARYLAITSSELAYARYFGYPKGVAVLERGLRASPAWRLVYSDGDDVVYRLTRGHPPARS
jgi:hypothetical protein